MTVVRPGAPTVAIVGSGPAGCYVAQALRRRLPDADLTVLDRLPVPYGLLRHGVAADHQGTKGVSRQFDRLFTRAGVRFLGNVEVGRDISLTSLRALFDVVVLCTGLPEDLALGIPGERLGNVVGSGLLTRALNGHPDAALGGGFRVGPRVVVIGAGNVAIDVARLFSKSSEGFDGSDIDDALLRSVARGVERIEVVSRSALEHAKFDVAMLRELGQSPGVAMEVHEAPGTAAPADGAGGAVDEGAAARRELALELAARPVPVPRVTIAFRFGYRPVRFLGDDTVRGVVIRPTSGAGGDVVLPADSAITAIGYGRGRRDPLGGRPIPDDPSVRDGGRLDAGLFVSGWLRTGPRGTIPDQRSMARDLAETVADDLDARLDAGLDAGLDARLEAHLERPSRGGFDALAETLGPQAVDFDGWLRIDRYERSRAAPGRVRAKVRRLDHLLEIARAEAVDPSPQTMATRSPA